MSDEMIDAEKQEQIVNVSQNLTGPTIEAVREINEGLKQQLEAAEGRLASPELKSALMEFKSEVQKFSEGLCGSLDKLLARIDDPKAGTICGKNLQALIDSGKFGYANPNITEANFPDIGVKMDFKVYDFGKTVNSDWVIEQMQKDGYRPANLRELLIWMIANLPTGQAGWNGSDWVVALGQEWRDANRYRIVPYLCFDGLRGLYLYWYDYDWLSYDRFLAVRNS